MPLFHTPRDYDLIVDWGEGPQKIQAKTSTCLRKGRWDITVCTRGGNQSWNGLVKRLDPTCYGYLFVVVKDGRRWLIPAGKVDGGSGIRLGGPKYEQFEIEPGAPLLDVRPPLH